MSECGGRSWRFLATLFLGLVLLGAAHFARAETLNQSMASAYVENPTLRAERARQRASDEILPQALSGWRPIVTARGDAGIEIRDTDHFVGSDNSPNTTVPGQFDITLS